MTLQSYFDSIYCINLKTRPDRWEECILEFQKHQLDQVIRVEAVQGIPAGLKKYGTMGLDCNDFHYQKKIAGTIGCLLSHLKIIEEARQQKLNRILILEDDIQFAEGMQETFSSVCHNIPADWSLLYLGGREWGEPHPVSENVFRVSRMLMSHAVGIDSGMYDELIELLSECDAPVDVYYTRVQQKKPCYVIQPYLAWQRVGWSDIEQRFRLYDFTS